MSADPFFRFESEFVDSLRCIPMAVRFKLDVSGVKLKLSEWSKLGRTERALLVSRPCATPPEAAAYRDFLSALVQAAAGQAPSLMPPADPIWESADAPSQILEKAAALGITFTREAWSALTTLQRFALLKLSRPGHENLNFAPALAEFGLLPR